MNYLENIELALKKGKIKGAKILLTEYFKKQHKPNWLKEREKEYLTLESPSLSFKDWLKETKKTFSHYESEIIDEQEIQTPIYKYVLIREYIPKDDFSEEIEQYLNDSVEYGKYLKKLKQDKLERAIITVSSGVRFYADPESRTDLLNAWIVAKSNGWDEDLSITKAWKTADGIKEINFLDLNEAITLGLDKKGKIVGAING